MKGYKYELDGKEYTLCYTGEAFFDIADLVGDKEFVDALSPETKEGFNTLCKAAAILSEQGELVRRYFGYEPGDVLDAEGLRLTLPPVDKVGLYQAVLGAIILGCKREITDKSKEVSLTRLAQLKKKESD